MEIEIDIEDISSFAKAAFVLDQPGLKEDILDLRRSWKIDKLIEYEQIKPWFVKARGNIEPGREAECFKIKALAESQDIKKKYGGVALVVEEEFDAVEPIEFDLEIPLRKHGLLPGYKGMLLVAILNGVIRETDLGSNSTHGFSDYFVSDNLIDVPVLGDGPIRDYDDRTKKELKRDREMYLKHNEGFTIKRLSEEKFLTEKGVKRAISRYRDFLKGDR